MNIILKNYNSSKTIAIEACVPFDVSPLCSAVTTGTSGLFSELGKNSVGLFECTGELFLWINGMTIIVDEAFRVQSQANGTCRQILITHAGGAITIEYSNLRSPVSTPFYSEDDEDADFGLWLCNVLASEERKAIILNSWRHGIS